RKKLPIQVWLCGHLYILSSLTELMFCISVAPITSHSSSQPGIPNLTLKYSSTLSPSVILKQEEISRNTSNISNPPKKLKTENVKPCCCKCKAFYLANAFLCIFIDR